MVMMLTMMVTGFSTSLTMNLKVLSMVMRNKDTMMHQEVKAMGIMNQLDHLSQEGVTLLRTELV